MSVNRSKMNKELLKDHNRNLIINSKGVMNDIWKDQPIDGKDNCLFDKKNQTRESLDNHEKTDCLQNPSESDLDQQSSCGSPGTVNSPVIKARSFYGSSSCTPEGNVSYSTIRQDILNRKSGTNGTTNQIMDKRNESKPIIYCKTKLKNQRKKPYTKRRTNSLKETCVVENRKRNILINSLKRDGFRTSETVVGNYDNKNDEVCVDGNDLPNSLFSSESDSQSTLKMDVSELVKEICSNNRTDNDQMKSEVNHHGDFHAECIESNLSDKDNNQESSGLSLSLDSDDVEDNSKCIEEDHLLSSEDRDSDDEYTGISLCSFIDIANGIKEGKMFKDQDSQIKRRKLSKEQVLACESQQVIENEQSISKARSIPAAKSRFDSVDSSQTESHKEVKSKKTNFPCDKTATGLLRYFKKAKNGSQDIKSVNIESCSDAPDSFQDSNEKRRLICAKQSTVEKKLFSQQLLPDVLSPNDDTTSDALARSGSVSSPKLNSSSIKELQTWQQGTRQPRKTKRQCASPNNGTKKLEQLYIDVGQRNFGHSTCPTCGMVYTKTLPEDALEHSKYHQKLMQKLKFKGWKAERILQEFHDGRIIQINSDDNNLHLKKVTELREVVDAELGFACAATAISPFEKAFLFVSNKKIVGCAIAVPVSKAYPVIAIQDAPSPEKHRGLPTLSWCCSSKPVRAMCGISRIWVLKQARRQKIAERLVDAVRSHFIFGVHIDKDKLAFSDPTPDGKLFAEKYSETPNILVFR